MTSTFAGYRLCLNTNRIEITRAATNRAAAEGATVTAVAALNRRRVKPARLLQ